MVKKLTIALMAVALGFGALAAEAKITVQRKECRGGCMNEWTPFALTLAGPVGLPWGDWDIKGLQLGVFNSVYRLTGLQVGVVNIADQARGVQIGIVNVITTDDWSFLPVFNWSF